MIDRARTFASRVSPPDFRVAVLGPRARAVVDRVATRHFVSVVLVLLMLQPELVKRVGGPKIVTKHGLEIVVLVVALVMLERRFERVKSRVGFLALPLGTLVGFWLLTGLVNGVSASTILIGIEWELRFLPLLVVVAAAEDPLADARLYGRVLVAAAAIESLFAIQWAAGLTNFQSTFEQKNLLGAFLALAIVYLAAAGPRNLGIPTRAGVVLGVLIAGGVFSAGSREGGVALVLGLLTVAFLRYGRLVKAAVAVALVLLAGVLTAATLHGSGNTNTHGVLNRWKVVYTKASLDPDRNIRVFLLDRNAKLVDREKPILGFGIGTASDSRLVYGYKSPVYKAVAPYSPRYMKHYVYDSNWAIVLLETGWVGIVFMTGLFLYLGLIGVSVMKRHWSGRLLVSCAVAVAALGFFGSAFQVPLVSAILWLSTAVACTLPVAEPRSRRVYLSFAGAGAAALAVVGLYAAVRPGAASSSTHESRHHARGHGQQPRARRAVERHFKLVNYANAALSPGPRKGGRASIRVENVFRAGYAVRLARRSGKAVRVKQRRRYLFSASVKNASARRQRIAALIEWHGKHGNAVGTDWSRPTVLIRHRRFRAVRVSAEAPRSAVTALPVLVVTRNRGLHSGILVTRVRFD